MKVGKEDKYILIGALKQLSKYRIFYLKIYWFRFSYFRTRSILISWRNIAWVMTLNWIRNLWDVFYQGIGSQFNHARNDLDALIINAE
jgi:hypothetical protein